MYVKYYFGRLPCKNRTASGDFLSAKMRSTEKSVFLDDFLQTRRMMYWTACYCAPLLFLRRQIGYLCVKQPATYGIQFWLFAFNYLDLPLVKMLCTLKPYFIVQILVNVNAVVCHTTSERLPKDAWKDGFKAIDSTITNGYAPERSWKRAKKPPFRYLVIMIGIP